jgi:hypothetical protein
MQFKWVSPSDTHKTGIDHLILKNLSELKSKNKAEYDKQLLNYAEFGMNNIVQHMLKDGANPLYEERGIWGKSSPLLVAAKRGNVNVIKTLLGCKSSEGKSLYTQELLQESFDEAIGTGYIVSADTIYKFNKEHNHNVLSLNKLQKILDNCDRFDAYESRLSHFKNGLKDLSKGYIISKELSSLFFLNFDCYIRMYKNVNSMVYRHVKTFLDESKFNLGSLIKMHLEEAEKQFKPELKKLKMEYQLFKDGAAQHLVENSAVPTKDENVPLNIEHSQNLEFAIGNEQQALAGDVTDVFIDKAI